MKQNITAFILALAIAFLIFASIGFASQITVEKKINQTEFITGEQAHISLEITNPFDNPVKIQAEDTNVLSNNGIIIECAEYTIPNKTRVSIVYSPLALYNAGKFTLGTAKITYTNPLNQKPEEIFSNDLKITVTGDEVAGNPHEMKKIYQCNGISKESTSFSSSSSGQQQPQTEQQQTEQNSKMNQIAQNNAQTLSSMKKQLQEQQAKEKQMHDNLKKKIEESENFKQQAEQMKQNGFEQTQSSITPEDENNGNFTYEFRDKNNNREVLHGNVKNNSVEADKFGKEEMNNAAKTIEENRKFKKLENELKKEGFSRAQKEFSPDFADKNINFNYTYKNNMNQTKNIIGNATLQGNVSSVMIDEPKKEDEENKRSLSPLWFLMLALTAVMAWHYWQKKKGKIEALPVRIKKQLKYNWRKDVNKHLQKAKTFFYEGRKKQACQELSFGVKLMFKHKNKNSMELDQLKKMTTTEIVASINDNTLKKKVKKCLEKIDMALFAKHKITKAEFEASMKISKEMLAKRGK